VHFPPGKSGNIARGAFGTILRRIASPDVFARIFAPSAVGRGPSGLADWPRPFVFGAAHLDGRTVQPGEAFHFDVHLFDTKDPPVDYFVKAFAELAHAGLGPGRGRAELLGADETPIALDLSPGPEPVSRVLVRFLTPTELKHGQELAQRPEFPILLARIRDRLSTLRALYGAGPLEIDFKALGERAAAVRMTRCELHRAEADRLSARTGRRHPLGGFVGEAEYEGDLAEFLPYLRAAKWTGVGRQTVWGKGVVEVSVSRGGSLQVPRQEAGHGEAVDPLEGELTRGVVGARQDELPVRQAV
jgi:hypothetical protein